MRPCSVSWAALWSKEVRAITSAICWKSACPSESQRWFAKPSLQGSWLSITALLCSDFCHVRALSTVRGSEGLCFKLFFFFSGENRMFASIFKWRYTGSSSNRFALILDAELKEETVKTKKNIKPQLPAHFIEISFSAFWNNSLICTLFSARYRSASSSLWSVPPNFHKRPFP